MTERDGPGWGGGWRTGRPPGHGPAMLVYILYLIGFAAPFAALAGLIVAYVKRDEADPVAAAHLDFQIRTFWLGLFLVVVGALLTLVLIGWLVLGLWTIWTLARVISGMIRLDEGRPVADRETIGFLA
jgi:uncharacterized membrane protein